MDQLKHRHDLAWQAMNYLEAQGVEITEDVAKVISAVAAHGADLHELADLLEAAAEQLADDEDD